MFGCPARVGLASADIPQDEIAHLVTEEDFESILKEMEGKSNDNERTEIENEEMNIVSENDELELESISVDIEERIVCVQCSTVLPLGKEVNNDGKCINCERQDNIVNERKRSRESLEKQATKMLKISNQKFSEVHVGTTVRVPIPDVDRARGSPRNVLAVVSSVEDGLYKLGKNAVKNLN